MKLSEKLLESIRDNAAHIEQGFGDFCAIYADAFTEILGSDWRDLDGDQWAYGFVRVGRLLRPAYIAAGMRPNTYDRFARTARGWLITGERWNFGNGISLVTAKRAINMAESDEAGGSWSERMSRAVAKVRMDVADTHAKNRVRDSGATILPAPVETVETSTYCANMLAAIAQHINRHDAELGDSPAAAKLRGILALIRDELPAVASDVPEFLMFV